MLELDRQTTVSFNLASLADTATTLGIGADFLNSLRMALKLLSPVASSAKQLLARIERSTSAPALGDQKNLVEANTTKIAACTGLLKGLAAPTQSHEQIIEHIDSVVSCNISLSKPMFIIRWGQAVL